MGEFTEKLIQELLCEKKYYNCLINKFGRKSKAVFEVFFEVYLVGWHLIFSESCVKRIYILIAEYFFSVFGYFEKFMYFKCVK